MRAHALQAPVREHVRHRFQDVVPSSSADEEFMVTNDSQEQRNQTGPTTGSSLKGSVSVAQAIWRGTLVVNGPVFVLCVGPLLGLSQLQKSGVLSREDGWMGVVVFPLSLVAAWAWWSFRVPKWRIWAYERVIDIPRLKVEAVRVGLTWPDGHVFSRTEWKSDRQRTREMELDEIEDPDRDRDRDRDRSP